MLESEIVNKLLALLESSFYNQIGHECKIGLER